MTFGSKVLLCLKCHTVIEIAAESLPGPQCVWVGLPVLIAFADTVQCCAFGRLPGKTSQFDRVASGCQNILI